VVENSLLWKGEKNRAIYGLLSASGQALLEEEATIML